MDRGIPSVHSNYFLAGLNGKSPNLYMYVLNNPLVIKDPTGRVPFFILPAIVAHVARKAAVGAGIGAVVYLISTPSDQYSFSGISVVTYRVINTSQQFYPHCNCHHRFCKCNSQRSDNRRQ